jgi:serine/threonine protein kinase
MLQTSTVGAVSYLAPEVMGGMGYTTSSDVFSFAVCAWEIITGLVPYEKER